MPRAYDSILLFSIPEAAYYCTSSSTAAARYAAPIEDASRICTIFTMAETCTYAGSAAQFTPASLQHAVGACGMRESVPEHRKSGA